MCDKNDNTTDIIGYTSGIVLSVCLLPQIYKIYKTKHVKDISYLWQILHIIGVSLHLYYGITYNLLPIFIPSIMELFLILILFGLKVKYNKNGSESEKDDNGLY